MDELRSVLIGTAGLAVAALVAAALTVLREPLASDTRTRHAVVQLFVIGLALQCLHFGEELVTGFHQRLPVLLGLAPWPTAFFVGFNLFWLSLWLLSVFGLQAAYRPAFFPVWFFALAMAANGIAHPLLSLAAGGYFPGLVSSPAVGVVGLLLTARLVRLTVPAGALRAA